MKMTNATPDPANDERMVYLVRNALLVASQEMGRGDEWPVVKDTIHKIIRDWENLKVERNVDEELKEHLYKYLEGMEKALPDCAPEAQAVLEPRLKELREVCDAYFAEISENALYIDDETAPPHIKRMKAIIGTLDDVEEDHGT